MEVTIKKDVTQLTVDLLCAAIEGGSNYWALMDDSLPSDEMNCPDYTVPVNDPEFLMLVWDSEDEDNILGELTQANLKSGWELFSVHTPKRHFEDALSGNWDVETADVFFQLAVLGEIVYG